MNQTIAAVILAAGKGTRINAPPTKNKVAFELAKKPMIWYTRELLRRVQIDQVVVVIGYAGESVKKVLGNTVTYAVQTEPRGTGHAVLVALPYLPEECTTVVTMCGDDSAFYYPSLLETLIKEHQSLNADATVVTLNRADPSGLGRIIRDKQGKITSIVEEKNATAMQKQITEINTGLYCFKRSFIEKAIKQIKPNSLTHEYYLPDVIDFAVQHNDIVHALLWPTDDIWFGVNTEEQLLQAEARMRARMQ